MKAEQLGAIRTFNRNLTRRIGALNDSFLGRGRPLGQARLLYEIGAGGVDLRTLRMRLGLDSGYLSRLLRALERQQLIVATSTEADARRRTISLSQRGRRELREYDKRSEEFAQRVLEPLTEDQREKLVAAMVEVDRLLRISTIELELEPADSGDAQSCLTQYYTELSQRFEAGFDPTHSISASVEELTPPNGLFVIARDAQQPVGCGALKVKADGSGEIKRMWVDRCVRGLGVGQRILARLEEEAYALGVRTLRLETNRALKEAQALYRRCAYREVKAFNSEPYAHHWFEKTPPRTRRRSQRE